MPVQQRVWMDDEQHRSPGVDLVGQENEEGTVERYRPGASGLLLEDDELLPYESVLSHQRDRAPNHVKHQSNGEHPRCPRHHLHTPMHRHHHHSLFSHRLGLLHAVRPRLAL